MAPAGSADTHLIRYRADIDGLRAVAVLSVIIFHFSRDALPQGFLGVDIFFVLSGFLITSIIWGEIGQGKFSIARFYERRIRRILPALLFLLVVASAAAAVLLLPSDLMDYARSLFAALGFYANIYFWLDTTYFTADANTKPLLHLWSLGVEEQFYLLFPILLALLARFWRSGVLPVVALIVVGSLLLDIVARKMGAADPAFYLLPTRAWELGAGALIALLPAGLPRFMARWRELLAGLAALLVAVGLAAPVMSFLPATLSSQPAAFATVVGTCLLLQLGRSGQSAVGRALAVAPVRFVGLISYSLYLWHWPVLVFARYYLVRELTVPEILAASVLMFAMAILSWRFVERPFRQRTTSVRRVLCWVGGVTAILLSVAAALLLTRGLPQRLSGDAASINEAAGANYHCPMLDYRPFGATNACLLALPSGNPDDADVVLLGNSHVHMYAPLWGELSQTRGLHTLLVPTPICLPTTEINIDSGCLAAARGNLDAVLRLPRARIVVIGFDWNHPADAFIDAAGRTVDNRGGIAMQAGIDTLIDRLRAAGKRVILIGPVPEPGWEVASETSRRLYFGHPLERPTVVPEAGFDAQFGPLLRHFESRRDIVFVQPHQILCDGRVCRYIVNGRAFYSDNDHLAQAELWRFKPMFEQAFDAATR